MAEKEGKNINTALKGVLASDSTLIGLVDGNVRQIETDVEGGLMSFDKGVTKEDLQSLEPIGKVELGDNKAVSGNEVFEYSLNKNSAKDLFIVGTDSVIFKFEKGYIQPPSNYVSGTNNWLSAKVLNSKPNTKYFIYGFPSDNLEHSAVHSIRVGFKVNGIWQTISSDIGVTSIEVITPSEYTEFYITIAAESGIAIDPDNNKYKDSFGIKETPYMESYLIAEKIKGNIETPQLKSIENRLDSIDNIGKQYFFGNGAPLLTKGKKGDVYLDVLTNIRYEKEDVFWKNKFHSFEIPIKTNIENIFTDRDVSVYRLKNKLKYIPKYAGSFLTNITNIAESYIKNFKYIDIENGDDNNNGEKNTPYKTIKKAINSGYYHLYIKKGFYHRQDIELGNHNILAESCVIICEDEVYLTSADPANVYTWEDFEGIKKTNRTGLISIINISSDFDIKTGFENLIKCSTIEECKTTLNSFFIDGANVYVNSNIDFVNLKLVLNQANLRFFLNVNCKMFYMENARVLVQDTSSALFVGSSTSVQSNALVCLKNINTYENTLGNGIAVDNLIDVFVQNCGGYGMRRDALNYHTSKLSSGFKKMNVIEINGWSYDTGLNSEGEGSSDGSTAHEGMSIYRFGGNFEVSRGSTVVDVNDGIKSINCDVTSIGSYLGSTASYQVQDGSMWLYNCNWYDSTYGLKADGTLNSPTIYIDSECQGYGPNIGNIVNL